MVVGVAGALAAFIMPLLVTISSEVFHLSTASAGRVMAAEMFGFAAGSVAIALLLSRTTISRLMIATLLITLACDALTNEHNTLIIFPLRFVAGLGEGGAVAAMAAVFANTTAPGRYYALYLCSSFLAATVIYRSATLIARMASAHAIYWVLAVVALLALPAAVLARRSAMTNENHGTWKRVQKRRTKLIAAALASITAYLAAWTTMWTYAVNIGLWAGLSLQSCDIVLGNAMFAGLGGAAAAAVLGSRLGNFIPLLAAGTTMALAAFIIALKLTPSTYPIAILLWMGGMQFALPFLVAVMSDADSRGSAASISLAAQMIGISIGPALGAAVIGDGSASIVASLSLALLIPSLATMLAAAKLLSHQRPQLT